jgi:hypothetical protein
MGSGIRRSSTCCLDGGPCLTHPPKQDDRSNAAKSRRPIDPRRPNDSDAQPRAAREPISETPERARAARRSAAACYASFLFRSITATRSLTALLPQKSRVRQKKGAYIIVGMRHCTGTRRTGRYPSYALIPLMRIDAEAHPCLPDRCEPSDTCSGEPSQLDCPPRSVLNSLSVSRCDR